MAASSPKSPSYEADLKVQEQSFNLVLGVPGILKSIQRLALTHIFSLGQESLRIYYIKSCAKCSEQLSKHKNQKARKNNKKLSSLAETEEKIGIFCRTRFPLR